MKISKVSVIIASRNRKNLLRQNLEAIDKQDFKGYLEIIVIDSGSSDGTAEMLKEIAKANNKFVFKYFESPPLGPATARNLGISHSKGDILIFLDDDSVVQGSDYVQKIIESFEEKNVGIAAGKTLDFYSGILKLIRAGDPPELDFSKPLSLIEADGAPTKNAAFLKEAVLRVGCFNTAFNFLGEDTDLCVRIKGLGYKLVFNEKALVYHYPISTFKGYIKKAYDIGFSHGVISSFRNDKPKISLFKIIIWPLRAAGNFIKKTKICFAEKLFSKSVIKEMALMFIWINANYCTIALGEVSYLFKKSLAYVKIIFKIIKDLSRYLIEWFKYFIKAYFLPVRRNFILYLTNKCNHRCQHCFFSESINKNIQELSLEDLDKIAQNYFSYTNIHKSLARGIWQGFTGGEPFLRNDLLEIISIFKRAGVENFQFNTNGMLTEKIVNFSREMFKKNIPVNIIISIDGLEKTHDKIRNTPGAFKKATQTIKELKNLGAEVGAIMTINKLNYKEVEDVVSFLNDNFGIEPGLQLIRGVNQSHAPVEFRGEANPLERNILISKDIIPEIKNNLFEIYLRKSIREPFRLAEFARKFTYLECHLEILEKQKRLFGCMAGKSVGVIYQNGNVSLCEFYKPIGNLKDVDFNLNALWNNSEAQKQRQNIKKCFCHHDCFINTEYNFRFAKRLMFNLNKFSDYV